MIHDSVRIHHSARVVLEGVPRAGYDIHLCPFPGSLYACLAYPGEGHKQR